MGRLMERRVRLLQHYCWTRAETQISGCFFRSQMTMGPRRQPIHGAVSNLFDSTALQCWQSHPKDHLKAAEAAVAVAQQDAQANVRA